LAAAGYSVHLRDPIAKHIRQASEQSEASGHPLASAAVGDARQLDFADEYADTVLLLGPLYHLTEPRDRRAALREARRVLRPGGVVLAAAISRFASVLTGCGETSSPILASGTSLIEIWPRVSTATRPGTRPISPPPTSIDPTIYQGN
jgi:ubiquinone/menaquinone biosynthesis C-methylase UbiE